MQWKAVMHSRLKLIVPLGLLFSFGCIDVPPVDAPPNPTPETDGGNTQNPPDGGNNQPPPDGGSNQEPQADFTLSVSPTRVSVLQGKGQTLRLSVTREGAFSGSVSVSAVNPPAGITVLPATIPAGSTSADLEVSVAESAEPGAKVLTLKGTAGELSHEAAFELTVVRLGDLLVSWTGPSQDTVYVNGSLPLQVSVEGGAADYVELLKGETVLTRLTAAPYQFTWDTTQTAEQTYTLTARAVRGASTFTTNGAKTVVVDRTAPTVVSRAPAPGASNVSVKATIEVRFSEVLKLATVKDASVLVSAGGSNVAKTLSTSADGKTLTVTPTVPLPVESTVSLTLGTGTQPLTDLAGNAVAATAPWTFTVPAWLPMGGAISAQTGNTPAENVAMKVGTDGVPVIAWSELDSAKNESFIYVRRWTGTQWESVGSALSGLAGAGTHAKSPALAMDGQSNPTVIWHEVSGQNQNLHGAKWVSSGWSSLPAFPAVTGIESRTRPSVVLDSAGNLLVASNYNDSMGNVQLFSLAPSASAWQSVPFTVTHDARQPGEPALALGTSGRPFIAYLGFWNPDFTLGCFVQQHEGGSNWSSVGSIVQSPSKHRAEDVSLVLDGAGNPLVAWEEYATDAEGSPVSNSVYVAASNGTSGSATWQILGNLNGVSTLNSSPSLLMGKNGRPLVAWSGFASPERSIRVASWDGSAWQLMGGPLSALSGTDTAALAPVLALDKNGQPLVAWQESNGTASDIYVYRYNY